MLALAIGKPPELPKMRSRASPDGAWEAVPRIWGFWKLQGRPGGSAASAQIDPVVPAPRDESDRPDRWTAWNGAQWSHAFSGKAPLTPRRERGITRRYLCVSGGCGQRARIHASRLSCCCVVALPSFMFRSACLVVCVLPRKTAEIGNVLVFHSAGGRQGERHKGPGAWASGGRAHMTWHDRTGLDGPRLGWELTLTAARRRKQSLQVLVDDVRPEAKSDKLCCPPCPLRKMVSRSIVSMRKEDKKKKDCLDSLGESSCGCNLIGSTVTARRHDRLVGVQPWPALFVWLVDWLADCALPTSCPRLSET